MTIRHLALTRAGFMVTGLALAVIALSARAQTPPSQEQAVFRGSTVLVPIDVRVLDKKGQPVTDLKAEDFTVFENGVRQDIKQFAVEPLTPGTPDPTLPLRRIATAGPATLAPQNRRLFLILLARGRLQGPSKGLDAVLSFVRERLLPQDMVALMAWNRATDFTTDHEKVAAVIERFIPRHVAIETELAARYSGLAGLYLNNERIPRGIQALIDDVFNVPAAGTRAVVVPGSATDQARADANAQANNLGEIEARTNLYRQFGTDLKLGDMMTDMTPVTSPLDGFKLSALRTVSQTSGGQMSVSEHGTDAIDRIVHATEFGYVLGYTPTDAAFDSKFRNIDVKVTRKNVSLSFRRGYFARPPEAFDPRQQIATTRMIAAANFSDEVPDLKLAVKVSDMKVGPTRSVMVETVVAADRIVFAKTATGALAAISEAVLCSDEYHTTVGELWRTVDVTVPADQFDEVKKTGLKLAISVPVTGRPVNVKVIVYDYGSDLLGSKWITR